MPLKVCKKDVGSATYACVFCSGAHETDVTSVVIHFQWSALRIPIFDDYIVLTMT